MFGKKEYQNISHVSFSHINNLRESEKYKAEYLHHTQDTQARKIPIGRYPKN